MSEVQLRYGLSNAPLRLLRQPGLFATRRRDGNPLGFQLHDDVGRDPARRVGGWHLVRSNGPQRDLLMKLEARFVSALENAAAPLAGAPGPSPLVVRPVYSTSPADPTPVIPTGELLLRFAKKIPHERIDRAMKALGAREVRQRDERTFIVELGPLDDPVDIASQILREDREQLYEIVEPNLAVALRTGSPAIGPASAAVEGPPGQWHLQNDGRDGGVLRADARVVEAWNLLTSKGLAHGDANIAVAVIDTGYDLAHPDLAAARSAADFASPDELDQLGAREVHGTAVAAIAVASAGNGPVIGVAPDCSLVPISLGRMLDADLVERWFECAAQSGARVVNCSWMPEAKHWPLSNREWLAIRACAQSGPKGVVICFCAGNDDSDIDIPGLYVNGFALHPDVIAVGASGCDDLKTPSSNHGAAVKICAPSGNALRSIVTAAPVAYGSVNPTFNGTSAAAPIVAGVAALVVSANPALTASQVRDVLLATARPLPGTPFAPPSGKGCVDAENAVSQALTLAGM